MASLCQDCDNDVFFSCKWVMRGREIQGWDATPIKGNRNQLDTFEVKGCPNFIKQKDKVRYCKICGRKLLVMQKEYCGEICEKEGQKRKRVAGKPIKRCAICGEELPKNKQRFCSDKCYKISFNAEARKKYRQKTSEDLKNV